MQQQTSTDELKQEFLPKLREIAGTASKFLQVYESDEIPNREKFFYMRQFTIQVFMDLAKFSVNKEIILSKCSQLVTKLIEALPTMMKNKTTFTTKIEDFLGMEILPGWAFKILEKELKEGQDEELLIGSMYTLYILLVNVVKIEKGVLNEMRNFIFNSDSKISPSARGLCLRAFSLTGRNPELSFCKFNEKELNTVYNWFYGEDEMKISAGFVLTSMTEKGDYIHPFKVLEECVKISMKYRQNFISYNALILIINSLLPADSIVTEEIVNPIINDFDNHTDEASKGLIIRIIDHFGRKVKVIEKGMEIVFQDLNNPDWGFNVEMSISTLGHQIKNHGLKVSEETLRNVEKHIDDPSVSVIFVTYTLIQILEFHESYQLLEETCAKLAGLIFNTASQEVKKYALECLKHAVNNFQVLEEGVITMLYPLYEDPNQEIKDVVTDLFEKNTMNLSLR